MTHRTAVGLGTGHIVLDGDPAPPRKDTQQPLPTFWRMSKPVVLGVCLCAACSYI